jgi:hypothetical protein
MISDTPLCTAMISDTSLGTSVHCNDIRHIIVHCAHCDSPFPRAQDVEWDEKTQTTDTSLTPIVRNRERRGWADTDDRIRVVRALWASVDGNLVQFIQSPIATARARERR